MGIRLLTRKKVANALVAVLAFTCLAAAQSAVPGNAARKHLKSVKLPKAAELAHNWAPPDIDETVPPTAPSWECPLARVLKSAGERAEELVSSLPRFAATERMEHYQADSSGNWGRPQIRTFEYLVEMEKVPNGVLVMDETRDGSHALHRFPAHIATLGLPAVAMVFHPSFAGGYDFKCEGLGNIDGYHAWQVHFQGRPDKLSRLRAYRVRGLTFLIKLKGRAWIDSDTFQILRIETDLLEPVPQIELQREHLTVDYRPVTFRTKNEELWLQKSAELFMDFHGRHYWRRHEFTNFMLFSVDIGETVKLPTEPLPQP
jgi:hypothetical protein